MTSGKTGQIIDGRYKIIRLLGKGGMGAVYLGQHMVIGKQVAIKFLRADLTDNSDMIERFYREARAAAEIGHRNIIDVTDVGQYAEGEFYLIMEYLEGQNLAEVLARTGPLDLATACGVLEPVLLALGAAHEKGIVHRDLKPENIFLVRASYGDPIIKLIDFGISKFIRETRPSRLTRTGFTLGTPAYMSPEHVRSPKYIDHRSDLFSIGVIFYELLTGSLPFDGDDYYQLLSSILTTDPKPLSASRSDLPEKVNTLIAGLLSKEPEQRPETTTALIEAIGAYGSETKRRQGLVRLVEGITKPHVASGNLGEHVNSSNDFRAPTPIQEKSTQLRTPNGWAETDTGLRRSLRWKVIWIAVALACATMVALGAFYLGTRYRSAPADPLPPRTEHSPAENSPDRTLPTHTEQQRAEVPQPGTSLTWLRCVGGTKWDGNACAGARLELNWNQASVHCPAGYRLPTRAEFIELLGGCDPSSTSGEVGHCASCGKSEPCSALFGDDKGWYWTSTVGRPDRAWFASFSDGYVSHFNVANRCNVRCVRAASPVVSSD